jgi:hypothetical protein
MSNLIINNFFSNFFAGRPAMLWFLFIQFILLALETFVALTSSIYCCLAICCGITSRQGKIIYNPATAFEGQQQSSAPILQ